MIELQSFIVQDISWRRLHKCNWNTRTCFLFHQHHSLTNLLIALSYIVIGCQGQNINMLDSMVSFTVSAEIINFKTEMPKSNISDYERACLNWHIINVNSTGWNHCQQELVFGHCLINFPAPWGPPREPLILLVHIAEHRLNASPL